MMFWYNDGVNGWGSVVMIASMVLFWALLIVGVVYLVRSTRTGGQQPAVRATTEQVLAERFAHGDIDESEYRSRLAVLRDQDRSISNT